MKAFDSIGCVDERSYLLQVLDVGDQLCPIRISRPQNMGVFFTPLVAKFLQMVFRIR